MADENVEEVKVSETEEDIVEEEVEETGEEGISALTVPEAEDAIEEEQDKDQIEEWLDEEMQGKQRKGVIEPLQDRLEELIEPDEMNEGEDKNEAQVLDDEDEVVQAKSSHEYVTPLKTMENVRIGTKTYSFKKGVKQKVPRHVAEWLRSRKEPLIK